MNSLGTKDTGNHEILI